MAGKTTFKIPKTLGECADRLYQIEADKKKPNLMLEKLDEERIAIEAHVVKNLNKKHNASGIAGKKALVQVDTESVPTAEDWDAIEKHVRKTGEFDLLQRRLRSKAVRLRWDKKKSVPGVKNFTRTYVSVKRLK